MSKILTQMLHGRMPANTQPSPRPTTISLPGTVRSVMNGDEYVHGSASMLPDERNRGTSTAARQAETPRPNSDTPFFNVAAAGSPLLPVLGDLFSKKLLFIAGSAFVILAGATYVLYRKYFGFKAQIRRSCGEHADVALAVLPEIRGKLKSDLIPYLFGETVKTYGAESPRRLRVLPDLLDAGLSCSDIVRTYRSSSKIGPQMVYKDENEHDVVPTHSVTRDQWSYPFSSAESAEIDKWCTAPLIDGELRPEELGISFPKRVEENSGFVIGGINSTGLIRTLTSINGIPIEKLEERMKPRGYSDTGFLSLSNSLLEVMADDNDFVISRGLTHWDMAWPLLYALRASTKSFTLCGRRYEMKYTLIGGPETGMVTTGSIDSPFQDGTASASKDFTIVNHDNGASLSFSALLPRMIARYGFYEGPGVPHRLEPADILKVFDFLVS